MASLFSAPPRRRSSSARRRGRPGVRLQVPRARSPSAAGPSCSWASPILIGYGLVVRGSRGSITPAAGLLPRLPADARVGGGHCLSAVVNITPRRRKQVLAAGVLAVVVLGVGWWAYETLCERSAIRGCDRDAPVWRRYAICVQPTSADAEPLDGPRPATAGPRRPGRRRLLAGPGLGQRPVAVRAAAYAARRLYRRGFNRLATGGTLPQTVRRPPALDRIAAAAAAAARPADATR